jgi:hypothetical protein
VPERNLDAWRDFAGEFSVELSEDGGEIERWVRSLLSEGQAADA